MAKKVLEASFEYAFQLSVVDKGVFLYSYPHK